MNQNKRHVRAATALILGLAALLVAEPVMAAGLFLPGRGVKPMGRAGAFVVSGDGDLNSLWYNPANIDPGDNFVLTFDAALLDFDFRHQRAPREMENGELRTYDAVENEALPIVVPTLLLAGPTGIEGLAWSVGAYAPYGTPLRMPADGAQRYILVDNSESLMGYIHGALSWKITENLRIGGGVQNFMGYFKVVSVTSAYVGVYGDQEDEDLDFLNEVTMSQYFSLTGNMGIWYALTPSLQAGLSVQLPLTLRDDEAKARARFPSHPAFDDAKQKGDTISTSINFPAVVRFGLRVARERFDVEAAVVYERWSTLESVDVEPNNIEVENVPGIGSFPVGPVSIPHHYSDTFSFRLGGDFKLTEGFTGRAGYAFEMGAVPDEYVNVFSADADKHMFGLGASWQFESFELDAGAAYFYFPDRMITTSKVRQLNPTDADNELTLIVGNGSYESRVLLFGVGVNYKF